MGSKGKMLGLFINSYDWHEWHDLVAVSRDKGKLLELIKERGDFPYLINQPLESSSEREQSFYVIEEVRELSR